MTIGRKEEQRELFEALEKREAQFVAVYGRRRVGKTFLIRETFRDRFVFCHTGLANAETKGQIEAFRQSICDWLDPACPPLKDWHDAFHRLVRSLPSESSEKAVVFIDELPWMDRPKSNFVDALEHAWNQWLSARRDIVLVVCGSASSWIVRKVFRDKGGLYGRVNRQIRLLPFTLSECEEFAREAGLELSREQILELYMVFGGVPWYWSLLRRGESATQAIDRLCFSTRGELAPEFSRLYASLFRRPEAYEAVVSALAARQCGLGRAEIAAAPGVPSGGALTKVLEDLEWCGFVRRYTPPQRKERDSVWQLLDAFTLFHFRFLAKGGCGGDRHYWENTSDSGARRAWRGLAFERVCLQHIDQIRNALGISGVSTQAWSWRTGPDADGNPGAQVDLVLDRADGIVDLCEMKCTSEPFAIGKDEDMALREKTGAFRRATGTRKAVHTVLVSANGIVHNAYAGNVQAIVTLDDLFK